MHRYHNNHIGTPQELTDDDGNIIWTNYEFAWGGTYQSYYKEQSINGIVIDKDELQPLKLQGQFYDVETGLHYNRFRYYDSDVGMFIQRDPIGLLGGLNTFQYAPNPIGWVDPWGLKCTEPTIVYRAMKKDQNGNFIPSPLRGSPNANQMGARTNTSNPKHNDFNSVNSETDMVGPNYTGTSGLSSSLEQLPLRADQVNAKLDVSQLPEGLGYINDHGSHISIYPNKDMTFGQYQTLLNKLPWSEI